LKSKDPSYSDPFINSALLVPFLVKVPALQLLIKLTKQTTSELHAVVFDNVVVVEIFTFTSLGSLTASVPFVVVEKLDSLSVM
jgi:hypothetical protein